MASAALQLLGEWGGADVAGAQGAHAEGIVRQGRCNRPLRHRQVLEASKQVNNGLLCRCCCRLTCCLHVRTLFNHMSAGTMPMTLLNLTTATLRQGSSSTAVRCVRVGPDSAIRRGYVRLRTAGENGGEAHRPKGGAALKLCRPKGGELKTA